MLADHRRRGRRPATRTEAGACPRRPRRSVGHRRRVRPLTTSAASAAGPASLPEPESSSIDAHDGPRQIGADGCGAHLEVRPAVAVAIFVFAGVDVSHHDHRVTLAQCRPDAGHQPAPAVDGDEQRIPGSQVPSAVRRRELLATRNLMTSWSPTLRPCGSVTMLPTTVMGVSNIASFLSFHLTATRVAPPFTATTPTPRPVRRAAATLPVDESRTVDKPTP